MDIDNALGWIIKIGASWALIAFPYALAKGHAAQQHVTSTRIRVALYVQHLAVACVLTGIIWLFYDLDGRVSEAIFDARRNVFALAVLVLTAASAVVGLNKGFNAPKAESTLSVIKAVAILRGEERKQLQDMVSVVTTALQREVDPKVRKDLENALDEAQQALEADRRTHSA